MLKARNHTRTLEKKTESGHASFEGREREREREQTFGISTRNVQQNVQRNFQQNVQRNVQRNIRRPVLSEFPTEFQRISSGATRSRPRRARAAASRSSCASRRSKKKRSGRDLWKRPQRYRRKIRFRKMNKTFELSGATCRRDARSNSVGPHFWDLGL